MTPEVKSQYIKYGSIILAIGVSAYVIHKTGLIDKFKKSPLGDLIPGGVKHPIAHVGHGEYKGEDAPSKVAVYFHPRKPLNAFAQEINEPYLMMATGKDSKNGGAIIGSGADFIKIKGTNTKLDGNHLIGSYYKDTNGNAGAFWIDIPGFSGPGLFKSAGGTGISTAYSNGTFELKKGSNKTNRNS
tara:strand:+ start:162 stop:719 length:558 start_codon:yes stop_codon:yes gene_type:complete